MTDSSDRPAIDVRRLQAAMPDLLPGLQVEVVAEAGSTNALVADRAREGAPEGLVVLAEHQTAGRGRLDRTWETPARSALTFSLLLRPTVAASSWPWVPLLTGYAVDKALTGAGFPSAVKWPNDVLLDNRKVAGVLSEVIDTGSGSAVVVGVGLNVGMTADELPVPGATSLAVSLYEHRDGSVELPDRTNLLLAVLQTLWEAYQTWQAGGELAEQRLAESYVAACATVGQDVRADLPSGGSITGRATGIDPAGRLLIATADGEQVVGAGDVVHLRTA